MMPEPEFETRAILHAHGLDANDITRADGFANTVLMTPTHVIRLNGGRFPDAFAHEARVLSHLPATIPHPVVVASGERESGGEYLVLARLPGDNLERVWPDLSPPARREIGQQLGSHLRALHELSPASWMKNPWVADAVASERWRDAYHAPTETVPQAIEGARGIRPDLTPLLERLGGFVQERVPVCTTGPQGFVHTDVHLRNILVVGSAITGLVDYEGSRIGPLDMELDQFVRFILDSGDQADTGYTPFIAGMRETYPAVFRHPDLIARLEVYEAQWHLVQLHHWHTDATWTTDPAVGIERLIDGVFAAQVHRLLV